MSFGKRIPLNTGTSIPQIGLGTGRSQSHESEHAVEYAIKIGYRHLDLAMIYGNLDGIRAALNKVIPSVVQREELFLTSKLPITAHRPELVAPALEETLAQLGLDYLDLYLIHWPFACIPGKGPLPPDETNTCVAMDTETSLVDTWKAMVDLPKSKVKAVGVSNFTIEHLEGIITATGVVPAVNQVEAHPLLPQDDLVAYCKEKNIHITAYSPLVNTYPDNPKLTDHPVVQEVAKELDANPAQILIAWGAARGYSVIPKSVNEQRIMSNFQQVELSKQNYDKVTSVGVGKYKRFAIPYNLGTDLRWDINVFNEPDEREAKYKVKIQ